MILEKIKKHGVLQSLKIVRQKLNYKINNMIYYLCWLFPVNKKLIVFESEGDLSDNAYALFAYMDEAILLKKYKVVWLVDNLSKAKKHEFTNTVYEKKVPETVKIKRSYYLATCGWYIYDHCNLLASVKKRDNCLIINLWHGCGFKKDKGRNILDKSVPDYMIATGKLFVDVQSQIFKYPKDRVIDLGYPRNDYMYKKISRTQLEFRSKWGMNDKKKIFLWMPTFRKSKNAELDENYFESSTGLPLIDTLDKLKEFNEYLKMQNCMCIFKLHHLQAELDTFKESYSNIKILRDEDIEEAEIQLYEVLPLTDCLISDYSSVTTDYLLLNKPIIYTIDDYEDYENSRGFAVENPLQYFAGHCVKNQNQFIDALEDIIKGNDKFREKRNAMIPQMHTYADGNASKRILDYFEINNGRR